ncbi:mycothiol transferase [Rhodococcus chondri]|uniref:DUF664 domain-containing protein n=1 Tax=Rhodococcus chondri TaxID=3065941 RepID=A0ABU7JUB7_9NOCA|nr:DUF664 domain-containing protein [Rhodococcus sp. CC-R104]MEE2033445.1 DUF664 domain-containing protein [Rhodococcus sp. CC-R104]
MTSTANETELILRLLDNQYDALRNVFSGLTEEQSRSVPSASSMSLASLLNHLISGHIAADGRITGTSDGDSDPVATWTAGWSVDADETIDGRLTRLDATAAHFAATLRAEPDLGRIVEIPDDVVQWIDQGVPFTVRFLALHQIEEWARHAGHADVIRESIDGATAGTLDGSAW